MRQNAHARLIKQVNSGTLLKHIRDQGPISRAELVKTTKLSPTTVSVIVEELLQEGLVTEVGMGESSGGRRPILLEFQPKARLAVGVDIGVRKSTVAILDLLGNTLLSQSYVPNLENKQLFMKDIIHHISEILQASESLEQDILGIGVATPGSWIGRRRILSTRPALALPMFPSMKPWNSIFPCRFASTMI